MNTKRISILDSTLRDGAQGKGISFSVEDKLQIVQLLDKLGVEVIEAGNPGSNPKELAFFQRAAELKKQGGFADARIPADQHQSPRDNASAQNAVKLFKSRADPRGVLGRYL